MNKTNITVASTKGTSTLVKAKFGPGMLLQHEDLEQVNSYTRDLSRLLFKSFFGCGVICGLVVQVDPKCGKVCITVGAGVALAGSGDPVHVPKDQTFTLDENCDTDVDSPLWVVLCGTVKQCAPRNSMCASDDDEAPSEPTRERDGFEIRVVRDPKCACGCDKPSVQPAVAMKIDEGRQQGEDHCLCADPTCHTTHYAGECGCTCGDGSDCGCECILLARLDKVEGEIKWTVDHRVRRFIRSVLTRDPQVEEEDKHRDKKTDQGKEFAKTELRMDKPGMNVEAEIIQVSQELDNHRQMITDLQNQIRTSNAELEPVKPQPAKRAEVRSPKEVQKKAPKNLEDKP